ncbi:GH92 family glycosyl hydrolase [Flavobacterium sp. M31R6]|uniref:GH92 family glycosyl hydrolase n=1 Tax=Flavobacterium sp. M31R6 TaxID=2739062 RepID=UPI0015687187|nr:GH92 family glycosyl hydrolase [Flavobacterium sp. M31R6]QKJ64439.1 glycoside hydrolase family 92 protein [Flavobacterium sp. M31R6]
MQKLSILFFLLFLSLESCSSKEESKDFTQFVNPFIGTDGTGHTFPGACLPFGMVQPSPDNVDIGWDYTSGYQYKNPEILGFSQTHLSGTGINDLGDVLLLPFVENKTENFKTSYNKKTEKASPGLYSVTLNDSIKVNLTATERVAFNQFIYPTNKAKLLIDIQHGLRFLTDSLVLDSKVSIESNTTISGYCHNKNWVERKYFFTLTFDTPFSNAIELPKKPKEKAPRYIVNFELKNKTLQAKIAFSTVSIEGAKNNLKMELPHWDFEQTVANAKAKWNSYLAKIEIEAPQKQKEIFYTSLYHLFTQPSNIADVDGKYRGADDKIATAPNREYYSTLSLWDTYRAANPLYTILVPERVNGFINTMLLHHKAAGYLPIWTVWGQENNCMIGNHAIPIITDAYIKGFKGFDANEALQAMIETTTKNHPNSDWTLYSKYGYYPFDKIDNESVSRTLESGYDDYCVALLAEKLGRKTVAKTYYKRASYYKNIFDKETGLMRGKDTQGHWRTPFDPLKPTSPMNNPGDYTEANAWQYSWASTQHDITGVTNLLGGKEQFTKQLNTFFTLNGEKDNRHLGQEGMIGQYAHGNEPSHHISYLYAYSNEPEKGKKLITQIYNQFYNNTPNGITGNDDCGQMSAWYIFTTLGFYPINPATGAFVFGMPQVKKATIHLAENITLSIICDEKSYKKTTLNGTKINGIEINYKQIMQGGELKFE